MIAARRQPLLFWTGVGVCLIVYLVNRPWDLRHDAMLGAPFGRDFVNFWLGGRLALAHDLPRLADLDGYNRLVQTTFRHDADGFIFSYPPHILLVLAPLALLPFAVALGVWTAANLAALWIATRRIAPAEGGSLALVACLSPASLTMVQYGHFGGLIALAFTVIAMDSQRRPWLAGACLAALTVKPQLAAVSGAALVLAGRLRCVGISALFTGGLVAASVAAFGAAPWGAFVHFTLPMQDRIVEQGEPGFLRSAFSAFRTAQMLGAPNALAWLLQAGTSLACLAAAAVALRREGDPVLLTFVVPTATLLALPYANGYDLAVAAPALTALLFSSAAPTRPSWGPAGAWLAPPLAWLLNGVSLPLAAALVGGGLVDVLWRGRRSSSAAGPAAETSDVLTVK